MSRYSALPTAQGHQRSASVDSIAASDSTYHSFEDLDLYEARQPFTPYKESDRPMPKEGPSESAPKSRGHGNQEDVKLQRRDSGYESIPSGPREGYSRLSKDRQRPAASMASARAKSRSRPSMRRAARSSPSPPTSYAPAIVSSVYIVQHQQQAGVYFHFPALDSFPGCQEDEDENEAEASYPPPPQTTHYWTSDQTRRLEYAAIDAASRGIKGWFLKHVPNCLVPKENRRVGFDDDSGSVRRYRLELECEEAAEKKADRGRKIGWLFGR
ncbi:hypothetical protein DL764_005024 [Monosporascus ibericus]|uniref:Uncharacterized protein n=1 Tax=Monosporascus ibericus TaxID=155417 RepID=A0A4Q4TAL6_9PEZI|nr:hypothetical protein DL764_005024 [Monosporascus ibericus]